VERTFGVMMKYVPDFMSKTDVVSRVCEGEKKKTSVDLKHHRHRTSVLSSKEDNLFENIKKALP
jgi:hypothetical protein